MQPITKYVDTLAFGVISPAFIKRIATINIVSPELYDADGYPVEKGLMDLSMGVIDPGLRCKVCGGKLRNCPGHFGYINLARPVIHCLYGTHIHELLRSFCAACGRMNLPQDKIEIWRSKIKQAKREGSAERLQLIRKYILAQVKKSKKCCHCSAKIIDIKYEKPTTFSEGEKRLWPSEIRERIEKIPDEDLELMGIDPTAARPEWFILTTLLVPPIAMRPSITLVTGERSEDDLTHKLSDIVRVNQKLIENINAGAPEIIIEDLWDLLQYHITTFFDNKIAGVLPARQQTSRPLRTLAQRLKGKEGRFRSNLAGKRVNFCARSVISPDPYLELDEVGVPEAIVTELTVPEKVTEWNIEYLKKFIQNNDIYPGANDIITEDGKRKRITEDTKQQLLEDIKPGWVVERHLLNGDIVIFNRQPSLHRLSLMAHRVKVLPGRTLRINPTVRIPYNADFDGDEMNLHVPQTEEARAEAKYLLSLKKHIVTPRYGLSIVGELEDVLVGLYRLLSGKIKFTRVQVSDYLIAAGYGGSLPAPKWKELWDGKQIVSLFLPDNFNFEFDFEKSKFLVEKGKVVEFGDKEKFIEKLFGPEGGAVIQRIYRDYGDEFTAKMFNALCKLGMAVARDYPYTVSFYDYDIPERTKALIAKYVEEAEEKVNRVLKDLREGKIAPLPGKTQSETAEAMIMGALNEIRRPTGELIEQNLTEEYNNLKFMAQCGLAKLLQLSMMSGVAGQQALRGQRISMGYIDRTLPHFKRGDLSPKAHGFIYGGYANGMDPVETFFQAILGRDSLMDTAMRTPKSGYMQRRLINALQDLHACYDGTVRNAANQIVQFNFGGDNIDIAKSDNGGLYLDETK